MTRRTDRLYLIRVGIQTVAIVPAKISFDAISKYITRTGFDNDYRYLCSYLMTNTVEIDTRMSNLCNISVIKDNPKTIDDNYHLKIVSQRITSCDNLAHIDPKDIDNPLFMRPSVNEVRNCVGFDDTPEYELRKFCI